MSGAPRAPVFKRWVGIPPADVARHNLLNTVQALEHSLEAPETSASQRGGLDSLRHVPLLTSRVPGAIRYQPLYQPQAAFGHNLEACSCSFSDDGFPQADNQAALLAIYHYARPHSRRHGNCMDSPNHDCVPRGESWKPCFWIFVTVFACC